MVITLELLQEMEKRGVIGICYSRYFKSLGVKEIEAVDFIKKFIDSKTMHFFINLLDEIGLNNNEIDEVVKYVADKCNANECYRLARFFKHLTKEQADKLLEVAITDEYAWDIDFYKKRIKGLTRQDIELIFKNAITFGTAWDCFYLACCARNKLTKKHIDKLIEVVVTSKRIIDRVWNCFYFLKEVKNLTKEQKEKLLSVYNASMCKTSF